MEKIAVTVKEAAQLLGVSPHAVYQMSRREDFPKVRKGRTILIPVNLLKSWFESQVGKDLF